MLLVYDNEQGLHSLTELSSNSKHWFTTAFLQQGAGKRCSECEPLSFESERARKCCLVENGWR